MNAFQCGRIHYGSLLVGRIRLDDSDIYSDETALRALSAKPESVNFLLP